MVGLCPVMSRINGDSGLLAIPCEQTKCAMWIIQDGVGSCGSANVPLEIRMTNIQVSIDHMTEIMGKLLEHMVERDGKMLKLYEQIAEDIRLYRIHNVPNTN